MASTNGKLKKVLWDDPSFAKGYKAAERVTRLFGADLLKFMEFDVSSHDRRVSLLDMACGTGAVSSLVQEGLTTIPSDQVDIVCLDIADAMLDILKSRIEVESWCKTTVVKADAQDTKLPSNTFDFIANNFGPTNVTSPEALLVECHRMIKPGGICGFSTWETIGWVPDICEAMKTIPDLPDFPSPVEVHQKLAREEWYKPDLVRETLENQGFVEVNIEKVNHASSEGLEELKATLVPLMSLVTSRFWTEEQRKKFAGPGLDDKIVEFLKAKYGSEPVVWYWVAMLARAKKPVSTV